MGVLDGKVAMVTGTARVRGIGRASALALAREGADLVITDIRSEGQRNAGEQGQDEQRLGWRGIESLAAEIEGLGRRVLPLTGDVSQAADVERMVDEALRTFGRIDVLLNNAAAPQGGDRLPIWEVEDSWWDLVIAVNLRGTFLCTRAVVRDMLRRNEGGRIISISSINGKMGSARRAAYCASKFGIIGFTQAVALEVAPHGITVNAVCPGSTDTARADSSVGRDYPGLDLEAAKRRKVEALIPLGRMGQAEDVANVVAFLASPAASYITGQAYNVSGGRVMH